jgi:hypothetical protein
MITKRQVEELGYTVLNKGGWFRIDPYIVPNDWEDICEKFNLDPSCKSAILCIAGVKEEGV